MKLFPFDQIFIEDTSLGVEISRLRNSKYSIIKFPVQLNTKSEIFAFVKNNFVLDPMLGDYLNWDGLNDSIAGGCYISHQNLAVIFDRKNANKNQIETSNDLKMFLKILFLIKADKKIPIDLKIYLHSQICE